MKPTEELNFAQLLLANPRAKETQIHFFVRSGYIMLFFRVRASARRQHIQRGIHKLQAQARQFGSDMGPRHQLLCEPNLIGSFIV